MILVKVINVSNAKKKILGLLKWVRTSAWEHINHMVLAPRMLFFLDNNDAFF